jgi:hypothetical protein
MRITSQNQEKLLFSAFCLLVHFRESLHRISRELLYSEKTIWQLTSDSLRESAPWNAPKRTHRYISVVRRRSDLMQWRKHISVVYQDFDTYRNLYTREAIKIWPVIKISCCTIYSFSYRKLHMGNFLCSKTMWPKNKRKRRVKLWKKSL